MRFAYWVNESPPQEPDNAKHALAVGDKVYMLDTNDQSSPDTLDKLAARGPMPRGGLGSG